VQLSDKIHACTLATSFGGAFGSELIWVALNATGLKNEKNHPKRSLRAQTSLNHCPVCLPFLPLNRWLPGPGGPQKSKEQSCATNDGRISLEAELTETRRIIRLIRGQPVKKNDGYGYIWKWGIPPIIAI
jgi:hypothetical protein